MISGADQSLIDTLCENLENERFTLIQAYCVRKDGSFFPSEIAVNKLHLESKHLCFFLRDITVRRQAEEMLRTEHNAIQNSGSLLKIAQPSIGAATDKDHIDGRSEHGLARLEVHVAQCLFDS